MNRKNHRKTLVAVAMATPAVLALSACAGDGLRDVRHATHAKASITIEKGWLPQSLPADARDIRVAYFVDDSDTAASWRGAPLVDQSCQARPSDRPSHEPARAVIGERELSAIQFCTDSRVWTAKGPGDVRFLWTTSG